MKNISSKIAVVLAVAVLATTQVYANEVAETEEVLSTEVAECQVIVKPESRISEILHKIPVISKLLTRTKMDYVAEDVILTNYMLGTPEEIASREVDVVAEEMMLENYMMASTETSEVADCVAEAIDIDNPFAELEPVAFAADLEEEDAVSDDFDFLEIDYVKEDLGL